MITYTCDHCFGRIGGDILITATDLAARRDRYQHFCSPICLSGWAVKNGHREAPAPADEPKPAKRGTLTPEDDAEILRQYKTHKSVAELAAEFGVSKPTVYNAINRAKAVVDDSAPVASESRPKPEPPQVNGSAPVGDPAPTTRLPAFPPRRPHSTAGCRDCSRTWNLTGRVLEAAIAMHEYKHAGHIVDIYVDQETATQA